MKILFFICCTTLILIACQLTDESVDKTVLAGKVERNLTIERDLTIKIMSDIGVGLGTGTFNIKKTDAFLTVSQSTFTRYGGTTPEAMGMLFNNLRTMNLYRKAGEIRPNLFRFPLVVGSTSEWEETGSGGRNLQAQVTIEESETVTVATRTFSDCLRHKTVFTNTEHEIGLGNTPAFAKVENALGYVHDVLKASIQQENWRLIAVNGTEIDTFTDLRESAKTWKSGDVLEVTIEENSETITLPVTLSGMIDNPPTARDANVRITKQTETTELQRTILANILGKQ